MSRLERWCTIGGIALAVIALVGTIGHVALARATTVARVAWTSQQLHRRQTPAKNEGFDPPPDAPNLKNLGKRRNSRKIGTKSREVEEKVTVRDPHWDPKRGSRTRTETRKKTIVEDEYSHSMDDYFSWDTTGIQETVVGSLKGTDNTVEYPRRAATSPGWWDTTREEMRVVVVDGWGRERCFRVERVADFALLKPGTDVILDGNSNPVHLGTGRQLLSTTSTCP